jgi:hypothetical protein
MTITMTTTGGDNAEYEARVRAFARELKLIYRQAGEPPLRDLQRALDRDMSEDPFNQFPSSRASISRYLSGKALPRGSFIDAFLRVLPLNDRKEHHRERLIVLRNAARDVIDPA